jgi:hypothetical protein
MQGTVKGSRARTLTDETGGTRSITVELVEIPDKDRLLLDATPSACHDSSDGWKHGLISQKLEH